MAKTSKPKDEKPSKDPRMNNAYMAWVDDIRSTATVMIERGGETEAQVANRANVHVRTLHNFLDESTMAPRADTLFKITQALEIPFGIPESWKKRLKIGGR